MSDRNTEIADLYKEIFHNQSGSMVKYDEISLRARNIFGDRNQLYGDSFRQTGVYGTFATLAGDVARLRNMIYKNQSMDSKTLESIEDKLLDVINQAIITLMMVQEKNWTGEESQ